MLRVRGLYCLDGTPLIDLKPERTFPHKVKQFPGTWMDSFRLLRYT